MNAVGFLYLSAEDLKSAGLFDLDLAMEDVEKGLSLYARGEAIERQETFVPRPREEEPPFSVNLRGGYVGDEIDLCGMKWLSKVTPSVANKYGLPRSVVIVMLSDSRKGIPIALMDGTLINQICNGARVGLAAKHLAKKNSRVLGMVGAGLMSRAHLYALQHVLKDLEEVKIYRRTRVKAEEFVKDMKEYVPTEMTIVNSAREAVEGADVIVTATARATNKPIIMDSWIKKGSFYVLYGWNEPEFDVILHSDKIVVMNWDLITKQNVLVQMYNRGLISKENIYAELLDIVTGKKPGRESEDERIFFTTHGVTTVDIAIATRVYRAAREKGIGQRLRLWTERDSLIKA